MAAARHLWAPGVLWALLLSQLFALTLAQSVPTLTTALECGCENFTPATDILNNGSSSICSCACQKTTWVPTTYTTVFTIFDPTISDDPLVTSASATLSYHSDGDSSKTATLSSLFSSVASSVGKLTTLIDGTGTVSSTWSHLFPIHNSTSAPHTSTASGIFWTGPGTGTGGTFALPTPIWTNSTKSSLTQTIKTSGTPLWNNSTKSSLTPTARTSSSYVANSSASLSVPESSLRSKPSVSTSFVIASGTTNLTPISTSVSPASPIASSTLPAQTDSSVATISAQNTSSQAASTSSLPTSSAVPVLVPLGGTITVEPLTATSSQADGTYRTTSVTWLSIDVPTLSTISGEVTTTSFPAWRCISLDLCNPSCLVPAEIGFGTNNPAGKTEPDEPEPSQSKKSTSTSTSSSTSSCTQTYTIAPHCTQPCVVSQIRSQGTSSFTTSCAPATCRTTQLCTSIETTTTTTYTTKRPKATGGCMAGKCPSCQEDKKLEARQVWWDEDILTETISEPEEWHEGEYEWWEKLRRIAKYYGPGLAMGSKTGHDSSASWEAFGPTPHGGGAGPVWGCVIVASFSPEGVYANHLWEIPNFKIPPEEEKNFQVDKGYKEEYYFEQNVNRFLQYGSLDTPKQKEFPALCPMSLPGGPLYGDNYQFFRTIVFVPIDNTGKMYYVHENARIMKILTEKCHIDKKYITVYGYEPHTELDTDFQYDLGRATPPPDRRASNPWDGLFSWIYTPKGPSGKRELVVRFEKDVIHRDAWCGDGLVTQPEAPVRFDLRPSPPRDSEQEPPPPSDEDTTPPSDGDTPRPSDTGTPGNPAQMLKIRQDEGTCPRMIACGLGSPTLTKCDYRKFPPPPLDGPAALKPRADPPGDPKHGPTKAEMDLSTDIMIDPEDSIGGERWWYTRMRHAVDERGPGFGGTAQLPDVWSTSVMVKFNEEVDGTVANRPRFGGAGPIWGCVVVVVASPEGIWTSHLWEIPTFTKGARFGNEANVEWSSLYPNSQAKYFEKHALSFMRRGNGLGTYKQMQEGKFPTTNPGLNKMFKKGARGPFDAHTKAWLWAGIIIRAHQDLEMPRAAYGWQLRLMLDLLKRKGVPEDMITVHTYAPHEEFSLSPEQIPPHWGLVSWQYHPEHIEGDMKYSEKKIRVRFEKQIIFEKTWCGSGNKIIVADGSKPPPPPAPPQRRQEDDNGDVEACLLAHSSLSAAASASSVAASAAAVLPRPTQACAADAECGSLACPQPRFGACLYGFCRCALSESLRYTKTPPTPVPGMYTNTALPVNYTSPTNIITLSTDSPTSILSSGASSATPSSTDTFLTEKTTSLLMPPSTKNVSSSTVSPLFTVTLSAWDPSKTPITSCNTTQDCSTLTCAGNQTYACITKDDNSKSTCHCVDRPTLFGPCTAASDCAHLECDANHSSACRTLVDFDGADPVCQCDPIALKPGAFCTVDSHCDGLPCDGTKNQRGFCKKPPSSADVGSSGGCQCDYFLAEGVGCASHEDCSPIRCTEAAPYKTCTLPDGPGDKDANVCACSATEPPRRHHEGDKCTAHSECATIGCTDYEVSVCEVDVCRCRAFMCASHRDCLSSGLDCGDKSNLRCGDQGRCECKRCTENFKILACSDDADCNHCCARGTLPKCVYGCVTFWCGKECQCELW
ncbi:hypothetical protein CORC01_13992 [Colletotrichum orchidophilum]|uniref:Uncharacterized protein n=1 Tax=Colletotrichum orchidophilum TaxID=1209926 RepID=A0A1G4ANF2_9PEZI|nr:uncharacterized protein CORC01_13992 [Colletotrichum orchidophilum]OHE90710.1 hypothetical protein CORC01_13992 [Colletotrichum orchidophilum]